MQVIISKIALIEKDIRPDSAKQIKFSTILLNMKKECASIHLQICLRGKVFQVTIFYLYFYMISRIS